MCSSRIRRQHRPLVDTTAHVHTNAPGGHLRGAAIGHFASTEITSSPGSRRLVDALERMGAPEPCVGFYREHIEADAVHEQIVRTDVVGDLIAREPHLERDVVFGIKARDVVEDRLAEHLMKCWQTGRPSLRRPLA